MKNSFKLFIAVILLAIPQIAFSQDTDECRSGFLDYATDGSFDSTSKIRQRHQQQNDCMYQINSEVDDLETRVQSLEDDMTLADRVKALEDGTPATTSTGNAMGSELMSLKAFAKEQGSQAKALSAATANAIPQGNGFKIGIGYSAGEFGSAFGAKYNINDRINLSASIGTTFNADYTVGMGLEIGFGGGK